MFSINVSIDMFYLKNRDLPKSKLHNTFVELSDLRGVAEAHQTGKGYKTASNESGVNVKLMLWNGPIKILTCAETHRHPSRGCSVQRNGLKLLQAEVQHQSTVTGNI